MTLRIDGRDIIGRPTRTCDVTQRSQRGWRYPVLQLTFVMDVFVVLTLFCVPLTIRNTVSHTVQQLHKDTIQQLSSHRDVTTFVVLQFKFQSTQSCVCAPAGRAVVPQTPEEMPRVPGGRQPVQEPVNNTRNNWLWSYSPLGGGGRWPG